MSKNRPTFQYLKDQALEHIGTDAVHHLEALEQKVIRIIQIQTEIKDLNEEQGYTDQHSGQRHPGLRDEVEKQFIVLNLFDGLQVEDFDVDLMTGKGPDYIDPIELLRLGVKDEIINKATRRGKHWTALRVQRRQIRSKNK